MSCLTILRTVFHPLCCFSNMSCIHCFSGPTFFLAWLSDSGAELRSTTDFCVICVHLFCMTALNKKACAVCWKKVLRFMFFSLFPLCQHLDCYCDSCPCPCRFIGQGQSTVFLRSCALFFFMDQHEESDFSVWTWT